MWYLQFSSCENGAFLLVEATVCCRSYYWSEIESFEQRSSCKAPTLARSLSNGRDCDGSMHYITQLGLLLSCDYVLKFDWYCQLSGSGSNSLNSRKLPGRFSYGLGTRLTRMLKITVWRAGAEGNFFGAGRGPSHVTSISCCNSVTVVTILLRDIPTRLKSCLLASYPGLLTPAFVACRGSKLSHVQWHTWTCGGVTHSFCTAVKWLSEFKKHRQDCLMSSTQSLYRLCLRSVTHSLVAFPWMCHSSTRPGMSLHVTVLPGLPPC